MRPTEEYRAARAALTFDPPPELTPDPGPPAELEHPARDLAEVCRRTCGFPACTGKGSTVHYAHRCQLVPDAPIRFGPCGVQGCETEAVTLLPAGRRCAGHTPPQPRRADPVRPTPARRGPVQYGEATTDPLGREGPGWHIGKQSRLPVRERDSTDDEAG